MILIAIISCPASAQEERNCDPKAGLVDGSCYIPRTAPWWKCEDENTHMTSPERGVTPEQQQRLEKLSLTLFASNVPDYGPNAPKTSRLDLISRFGQPVSVKSTEVPRDPLDRADAVLWVVTTWEYRGLRITTLGEQTSPDQFWVDEALYRIVLFVDEAGKVPRIRWDHPPRH